MFVLKSLRFVLVLISFNSLSQQLLINEISQGSGAKEYVELVVVGTPTCQVPVPCMDLRGIILDDNNGYFASGSGTGIAPGAVRFADNPFWSCIPQGTLIVIFNDADVNPALPPIDESMNDGNCRLIIPINSLLFEGQGTSPTSANTDYPTSINWIAGGGNWSQIAMSNTNDSFQVIPSLSNLNPVHGVSWGNNTTNSFIYFNTASGNVFSMMNTVDNNAFDQANWSLGAVGVNETPGVANSPQNDAWIGSMNPDCGISNAVQLTVSSTQTGCGATCTGTATVNISGGVSPYIIDWSNGGSTTTISNLCAGNYTVEVTDAGGCSTTEQVTVSTTVSTLSVQVNATAETCAGDCDGAVSTSVSGGTSPYSYAWNTGDFSSSLAGVCPNNYSVTVTDQNGCSAAGNATVNAGTTIQDATISTTGPFTTNDTPVQFSAAAGGGTWSADCGTCITSAGVFSPQNVTAGTYQICYTIGSGACASSDCQTIVVTEDCTPQFTSEDLSVCPGTVVDYNGQQYTQAGVYTTVFTDINDCDSTHTLYLNYYTVNPQHNSYTVCFDDSIEVNGTWYDFPDFVSVNEIDNNGCSVTNTTLITFDACILEDFNVFIPNVFTPNGDEVNNVFEISLTGGMLERGFVVNRWGNVVHEFHADDLIWDGTTKQGMPVQDGVYSYVVYIRATGSAVSEQYHGFVTLIR